MTYWGQVYPMTQKLIGDGVKVADFFNKIVPIRTPPGQFFYTGDPPWKPCDGHRLRLLFQFEAHIVATADTLGTRQDYASQPGFSGWLRLSVPTIKVLSSPITQADFTKQFGFALSKYRHLLDAHEAWFDAKVAT